MIVLSLARNVRVVSVLTSIHLPGSGIVVFVA